MTLVKLKPNAGIARIAASFLGSKAVALVIRDTIFLYGVSKEDFAANDHWVRHELKHVEQYHRFGLLGFMLRYGWWSLLRGYHNNPLEIEARAAEANPKTIEARLV